MWQHLRICSKPYRKRYGSTWTRGKVPNRVGIENRPAIVDQKSRIGDWEADTIVGKDQKSALLTLVERVTRYTIICKLDSLKSDSAMIDYLTFIFGIETVYSWFPNEIIGDNQIIEYLSLVVDQIFGFGVLCKLPGKGKFFYDGYYQLGPDNANYGQIHVGGQNDTVLIDLKGVGCMAAKQGWEVSLYHFLKHADCPRITRIDLPILR